MSEIKFPAEYVAHWATGPVNCCQEHMDQIVMLGNFLGAHVAVTQAQAGSECVNCINEAAVLDQSTKDQPK